MSQFDPYRTWLGIAPEERPVSLYRLLGVQPFETDLRLIDQEATRRAAFLQQQAQRVGPQAAWAQRLLQEVWTARNTLVNPQSKMIYDQQLRQSTLPNPHPNAAPRMPVREQAEEFVPVLPDENPAPHQPAGPKRWLIAGALLGVLCLGGVVVWMASSLSSDQPNELANAEEERSSNEAEDPNRRSASSLPEAALIPAQEFQVDEGQPLAAHLGALSAAGSSGAVRYRLVGDVPEGCTLEDATGKLSWVPAENQGPGRYRLTVAATDGDQRELAQATYLVQVDEINEPPLLTPLARVAVNPLRGLHLPLVANDPDWPANRLVFSLGADAPEGLTLEAGTGLLAWKPESTAKLSGDHEITIRVTDNGSPPRFLEKRLQLSLLPTLLRTPLASQPVSGKTEQTPDSPRGPVVEAQATADHWVAEGQTLTLPLKAKGAGLPESALTYTLVGDAPSGSEIDPKTGTFRWTAPPGSAATKHFVTVRINSVDQPSLGGQVRFQIVVEGQSPDDYLELPDLPGVQDKPETVVLLKRNEFPSPPSLKLLGIDEQTGRISSRYLGETKHRLETLFHPLPGAIKEGEPAELPMAEFFVQDNQVCFRWTLHKDTQIRKYQQLIREAVLEVQAAGRPARYYALRKPIEIFSQSLGDVLKEPYEPRRLSRWNLLPTKTARQLIVDDVKVHLNGEVYPAQPADSAEREAGVSTRTVPEIAALLTIEAFELKLEEQADELVWTFETKPSVREVYQRRESTNRQMISKNASLQQAQLNYSRSQGNYRQAQAIRNARVRTLELNKAAAAINLWGGRIQVYQAEKAQLYPLQAQANQQYQQARALLTRAMPGVMSASVYRVVNGFKLNVLTIREPIADVEDVSETTPAVP